MTPVIDDLLWLLLNDETGRLLTDRHTTGCALTVAAGLGGGTAQWQQRGQYSRQLRERSLRALHITGRVGRTNVRLGGVVPRAGWPTADPLGKQTLRLSLQRALFDAQSPDHRTRSLIAILHTVDALVYQCPRWSHRETAHCARQLIACHDDCAQLVELLHYIDRAERADALSFGARPLFTSHPA